MSPRTIKAGELRPGDRVRERVWNTEAQNYEYVWTTIDAVTDQGETVKLKLSARPLLRVHRKTLKLVAARG